jgi:hypothetical protein
MMKKRINPLSRRPRNRRLVVAVRGAAGTGKSVFASTLADAGLGRLCFFDVERKGRLLPGSDGTRFDALEIEHPDELPEFIDWALDGEGREQGYGCYALDSWAMYFGRKHRETIQSVREHTGNPTAQPSADELANDQMVFQEVLRRLCIDSGACVVITDQIPAKGREEREENEMGRVLPMTSGGLEYFVDVMVELNVRIEGFRQVRVARVIKSNSPDFPVGLEIENPTFSAFIARLGDGPRPVQVGEVPEVLDEVYPEPESLLPSLDDLLAKADEFGLSRADVVTAARYHCGTGDLHHLHPEQIDSLFERLVARYGAPEEVMELEMPAPVEPAANGTNGRARRKAS